MLKRNWKRQSVVVEELKILKIRMRMAAQQMVLLYEDKKDEVIKQHYKKLFQDSLIIDDWIRDIPQGKPRGFCSVT